MPVFARELQLPIDQIESIFLFGPRGTGKTNWLKLHFPNCVYIDLLLFSTYQKLSTAPDNLQDFIPPGYKGWIIIDEVQRVPELLNEVHRQIESNGHKFILTGSSARKLRRNTANLLAGRAFTYSMHPLVYSEIGEQFDLEKTLEVGLLPSAQLSRNPKQYLQNYFQNYIREEVFQEAVVRNNLAFSRFVEIASFSQGKMLNISSVAREAKLDRQVVTSYFDILEDLLIAVRIPAFTKRAKREVRQHPKFYYFDVGVYRTIRPSGYLDSPMEADGPGLETLFLQSARAVNGYHNLGYEIYYWRTVTDIEVDFILYGDKGLYGFEVKRTRRIDKKMLKGLKAFAKDYPSAKLFLLYTGYETLYIDGIEILPMTKALGNLPDILR